MVDLTEILSIVSSLGVGTVIGAVIVYAKEHHKIERQFRLDIIKNRIKVITKLSTEYLLIGSALSEFYKVASKEDDELKFYFICKFFYYYTKITEEEGGFEFDNRPSENVITQLIVDFFKVFDSLGYEIFSEMADQVTKDEKVLHYNEFKQNISKPIFQKFLKIISDITKLEKLKKYSLWMAEIILFETNSVYRHWYNENPKFSVDPSLISYLANKNFVEYLQRITLSNKSRLGKAFHIKGNYF